MGFSAYGKKNKYIEDTFSKIMLDNCENLEYSRNLVIPTYNVGDVAEQSNIKVNLIIEFIDKCVYEGFSLEDISYNFQKSWVSCILKVIEKIKDISKNFCGAGGCFLNVELNRKIIDTNWFEKVEFTPVSNDSGQALGAFLKNEDVKKFTPFCGGEAYDLDNLGEYLKDFNVEPLLLRRIAEEINNNKIVGVFRGEMEIGPRALGNRSILANTKNPDMKDILNQRVKHREWYRPFGAIVRREDISKYFDLDYDVPYMNILVYNKTNKFPAITHIDNSTRIQTVTKEQNQFIYDLLGEIEKVQGDPIVINTSFNVKGKPIINWYSDALQMLKNKEIDYLVLDDKIISAKM